VFDAHAIDALRTIFADANSRARATLGGEMSGEYVARTAPWLPASPPPQALIDDLHIELGYLYNSSQGTHADPRTTCGMPGSRAPHLWLNRSGERVSTLDLVRNYTQRTGTG